MNDSVLLENYDAKPQICKYACKIIPKSRLFENERQKKKTEQELQLHKGLSHKHIVQFKHFFEDDDNIYIMLELCDQRSLQKLIENRSAKAMINGAKMGHQGLQELEVRYFMSQIISALEYLYHDSVRIVHRDLSLNNIFLGRNFDDTM